MDRYFLPATSETPMISFDPEEGIGEIAGRSIPVDAEAFYQPLMHWMENASDSISHFSVHLKLDFINIASTKRLLKLLYKMQAWHKAGKDIDVIWYYPETDKEMKDVGKDFSQMVPDLPFSFRVFERSIADAAKFSFEGAS